jgi:hypothetical protein
LARYKDPCFEHFSSVNISASLFFFCQLETIIKGNKQSPKNSKLAKLYEYARKELVAIFQREAQEFCQHLAHHLIRVSLAKRSPGALKELTLRDQIEAGKFLSPSDRDLLVRPKEEKEQEIGGGVLLDDDLTLSASPIASKLGFIRDFIVADDGAILPAPDDGKPYILIKMRTTKT